MKPSFGFSSLPEHEDYGATLLIYGPLMRCGLSGKVLIISENVGLLHIYDVFLFGHGKGLIYIEKPAIFPSRSSYAINIYIYIAMLYAFTKWGCYLFL